MKNICGKEKRETLSLYTFKDRYHSFNILIYISRVLYDAFNLNIMVFIVILNIAFNKDF